jgi:hypothetical protein
LVCAGSYIELINAKAPSCLSSINIPEASRCIYASITNKPSEVVIGCESGI